MNIKFSFLFFILCITLFFSSCGTSKNAIYFNENINDRSYLSNLETLEPVIQTNDLLSITISSINLEAAEMFNQQNDAAAKMANNSGGLSSVSGYLVGQDGYIRIPLLGSIKAVDRTKKEVREEITSMLLDKKLLIEPIVDIRYLNYKVSILGEVKDPSVLTIPNERISLLEALGQVGDITIYGRRDNVTLIREVDGVKRIHVIDLNSDEIFQSQFYYLQSNDIIYVQPNKSKIMGASEFKQWIPVILSAISLAVVTVVTLR